MPETEVVGLGEAARVGINDDVVVNDDAPVEKEVFQSVRATRIEQENDAAGPGGEEIAQQLLLERLVAALGRGDEQQRGIIGDLMGEAEVETGEVEIALPQLGAELGEAAHRVEIIGPHLAMAGKEINLFLLGVRNVEDRGGEGGLALEGFAAALLGAVEIPDGEHAAVALTGEEHHVGLVEAEFIRPLPALVDVEIFDLDAALGAGVGDVDVFAEQPADIAVDLSQFLIIAVVGERDRDTDVALEQIEVGFGLGGERMPPARREVETQEVVLRDVVEPAEQGEEQHRLQEQVAEPDPAGGAEAVGEVHGISRPGFSPRRREC